MTSDQTELQFLERAVALSRRSQEAGGFPVAAILVRDGREVAYGLSSTESTRDVTAHGEIQAIRAAGAEAFAPLTLYSSLEPCLMCLAASAWAGVTKIVYACGKESVNSMYYVNNVSAREASKLLTSPPELLFISNFQSEVLTLIRKYEGS